MIQAKLRQAAQGGTLNVRNPRSGVADTEVAATSIESLDQLVAQARAAQRGWQDLGLERRIAVLAKWRDNIAAAQDPLIAAVSHDTGRRAESLREAGNMGKWIDRWSDAARHALVEHQAPTSNPAFTCRATYEPLGLVGIISPWNFPMSLSVMDAIPALLAGNAVIIKPSEVTPRFIDPLTATFAEIPELKGVLTYIKGAGDLGAALVDRVDGVVFTGSTATGRKVAAQAAARLVPFFVELGGKDAAIVLEGADLERAAASIVTGATLGAGQQCYSIERIYVQNSVHDAFIERLTAKARALKLAWPEIDDGQIGPMIHAPQADIIADHIADAVAKGATVLTGGKVLENGGGRWVEPTVLTGVTHDMTIMREESFGPLMPVMAVANEDEALRLANDSEYGLYGAVFGPHERAISVACRMQTGGVCVNDSGASPFFIGDRSVCGSDSFGASGLGGTRHGPDSIRRFVRTRMILDNICAERSPWWYDV